MQHNAAQSLCLIHFRVLVVSPKVNGMEFLKVEPEALRLLSSQAMVSSPDEQHLSNACMHIDC